MASLDISDPDIQKYIKLVQDGSEANRWIVFSYVPKSNNKIKFCDTGSGDLKELREELDDSSIRFAYIRFTINNMKKFVYIPWCGDGVNGPIKGAFSGHAIEFSKMFKPIHHQVNARSEEDIDEKAITAALNKATGASYDSGSKVQGATKGTFIPSSVSQGREAATKSNAEVKNIINKNDYNKVQESTEYWKQNQAVKTEAPKPVRTEYNLSTERDDYWKQQQAEKQQQQAEKQQQQAAKTNAPPPSRTVGNRFQQQTQQQETVAPPPPRAAPSKGVLNRFPAANTTAAPEQPRQAPPPARPSKPVYQEPEPEPVYEEQQQQYEEPQYEEQQYEQQQYEEQQYEQPAEEQQQYYQEEQQQQHYEEPQQQYEEQQYTEEPQYEQPAEEQQYYQEEQQYEQPAEQQYEEQQYTEEQQYESYGSQVKALYDYTGENEGDLSFREGDIITIIDQNDPDGWWQGSLPTGESGFFPSNHVCAI